MKYLIALYYLLRIKINQLLCKHPEFIGVGDEDFNQSVCVKCGLGWKVTFRELLYRGEII